MVRKCRIKFGLIWFVKSCKMAQKTQINCVLIISVQNLWISFLVIITNVYKNNTSAVLPLKCINKRKDVSLVLVRTLVLFRGKLDKNKKYKVYTRQRKNSLLKPLETTEELEVLDESYRNNYTHKRWYKYPQWRLNNYVFRQNLYSGMNPLSPRASYSNGLRSQLIRDSSTGWKCFISLE